MVEIGFEQGRKIRVLGLQLLDEHLDVCLVVRQCKKIAVSVCYG